MNFKIDLFSVFFITRHFRFQNFVFFVSGSVNCISGYEATSFRFIKIRFRFSSDPFPVLKDAFPVFQVTRFLFFPDCCENHLDGDVPAPELRQKNLGEHRQKILLRPHPGGQVQKPESGFRKLVKQSR
jgi:hypothetical protein